MLNSNSKNVHFQWKRMNLTNLFSITTKSETKTQKKTKEQTNEITPSPPQPSTSYANTNNEKENAKRSFQR